MSHDVVTSTDYDVIISVEPNDDVQVLLDFEVETIDVPEQGPPGPAGAPGTPGKDGNTVMYGSGPPSPALGKDGDFYIDMLTHSMYGPKAGGIWPSSGTSLVGPRGTAVLYGSGPPTAAIGIDGDFYIDTATHIMYGPKASGSWPATGTSLIGPPAWATPPTAWATGTNYTAAAPASVVTQGAKTQTYVCAISHTSGTFSTDLAAGKWVKIAAAGADGFVGSDGRRGSFWFEGAGAPGTISGVLDQDNYLNTTNGDVYNYSASGSTWGAPVGSIRGPQGVQGIPGSTTCYIGDTPPASPADGTMWWKSDIGQLYVRFNDGSSVQWVAACPTIDATSFVQKAGDTMAGALTLAGDPTAGLHAATKQYVDSFASSGYTLVESHAANAVTYAVKTLAGVDATALSPIAMRFRNGAGGSVTRYITGPLSITIPATASLGAIANQCARVWLAAFDDAGTVKLAVRLCSAFVAVNSSQFAINPMESTVNSSTVLNSSATSYNVFYSAVAVTSKYWKWIGYFSYENVIVTPGNWVNSPDFIEIVEPTTPRPGQVLCSYCWGGQTVTSVSASGVLTDIGTLNSWSLGSGSNLIRLRADGYTYLRDGNANHQGTTIWTANGNSIMHGSTNVYAASATDLISMWAIDVLYKPNTTGAVNYRPRAQNASTGTGLVQYAVNYQHISELMG